MKRRKRKWKEELYCSGLMGSGEGSKHRISTKRCENWQEIGYLRIASKVWVATKNCSFFLLLLLECSSIGSRSGMRENKIILLSFFPHQNLIYAFLLSHNILHLNPSCYTHTFSSPGNLCHISLYTPTIELRIMNSLDL